MLATENHPNPLHNIQILYPIPEKLEYSIAKTSSMLSISEKTFKNFILNTKLIKLARNKISFEDIIKISRMIHTSDFPYNIMDHKERKLWVDTFLNEIEKGELTFGNPNHI